MPLTFIIPAAIIVILIAFWLWMFYEMLHNDDIPNAEPTSLRWPPLAKNHWIVFFITLSIFTASYYYFTIYREKQ